MVEWLAGNRIRGTSAEKPVLGLPSGSVGGWKELARTTLGSGSHPITVSDLPDKRYYMVLAHNIAGGSINWNFRVGTGGTLDTSSNYADRHSSNGGGDATTAPANRWGDFLTNGSIDRFTQLYISNLSGKEKLMTGHIADRGATNVSSGSAPERAEVVGKWTNTSLIDVLSLQDDNSQNFGSGSEMVVLGWDPADTHTTNFWEELVDTSWSSGSSVETSAFATKKYLWYQGWFKTGGSMSGSYSALQVGSGGTISTSGYAERYSINGANDGTETNKSNMYGLVGQGNDGSGNELTYINGFIINNSANEKLLISDAVGFNPTTGSGSGSEPRRTKGVGKWVTTGSQINKMKILSAAGSGAWVGGQLKVWGSD
jgi:hypothetical protein